MMEQAIAEYLINALWQLPLLGAGAWLLVRLAKPRPQVQYCLWLAVLSLAVLLPVHGMSRAGGLASQPARVVARQDLARPAPWDNLGANHRQHAHDHGAAFSFASLSATHTVGVEASWVQWLVRLYLGTVIVALVRVAQGWRAAWLLTAHARVSTTHETLLVRFSRRFRIVPPQARESVEIASPMIVGITSPVLLLPENFTQFTAEEISAALCHELAHIKRQDYLVNLGCQLAAVPLLWHPAIYLIQQRIRLTREMACDALAAEEMKSEVAYAKCLLSLAHRMLGGREMATEGSAIGLFGSLFGKNTLEERIMQLTEKTTMGLQARVSRIAAGAAMMSASFVLTATFHLAPMMADTQKAPNPLIAAPAPPEIVEPGQAAPTAENKPVMVRRHAGAGLTATQRAQLRQQIETARKQAAAAAAMINSQAFEKQMEEARWQAANARDLTNSPQFQLQMEEARRQAAKARDLVNSPEFKKQIKDTTRHAREASAMVETPEFKRHIEAVARQAMEATRQFDDAAFQRQMEEMQRKMNDAMKDFHLEMTPPTPPTP